MTGKGRVIKGQWPSRHKTIISGLRAEGYLTSGDIANILGVSRPHVAYVMGKADKRVKIGNMVVNLWLRSTVEAKLAERAKDARR